MKLLNILNFKFSDKLMSIIYSSALFTENILQYFSTGFSVTNTNRRSVRKINKYFYGLWYPSV